MRKHSKEGYKKVLELTISGKSISDIEHVSRISKIMTFKILKQNNNKQPILLMITKIYYQ